MKSRMKRYDSVSEYINDSPAKIRSTLRKMRVVIRAAAPKAEETISYGMPAWKLNGKHLVFFAAHEKHIGFYPTPSPIIAFKKELSPYKRSKGAIQFPVDKPVPYGLIKRILKYRVKEIT
ncbi:DUF1801 domain-containing protein [candidate division WOR-3 bacterium]|nr:DUF1801 domain-containing protein [candidate division WOR-3 bacterium]